MHTDYTDIRSKIKKEPLWFDEDAVPRYDKFTPKLIADIYADECALVLIACQNCHHEFKVSFATSPMDMVRFKMMYGKKKTPPTLRGLIVSRSIHYGDPPNIRCCAPGPSMNCDDIRVLEYWVRDFKKIITWKRVPKLEIELT